MASRDDVDLRTYLAVIRRRKGTILLATLIITATALAASLAQEPVYQSTASVLIQAQPTASSSTQQSAASKVDATRALKNQTEFAQSDAVLTIVRGAMAGEGRAFVSPAADADVLTFTARHRLPAKAAEIANVYARTFIDLRREATVQEFADYGAVIQSRIDELRAQRELLIGPLGALEQARAQVPAADDAQRNQLDSQIEVEDARISGQRSSLDSQLSALESTAGELDLGPQLSAGGAQLVQEAKPARSPIEPTTTQNVLLGLAVGLVVGLGLAFLVDQLDDSIRTRDDLEAASGVPAVGLIPRVDGWGDRHETRLVAASDQHSPAAEAYRSLRTSVQFLGIDRSIRTVMITSPKGAEGKSTTTVNLAVTLALSGLRVAVVDCDLRRSRVSEFFQMPNEPGLTTALAEGIPLHDIMQLVNPDVDRLGFVGAGPMPPNPAEILASSRTEEALRELEGQVDILLLDVPPVLPVTDALIVSAYVDAVLLLAGAHQTTKHDMALAAGLLRQVDAPLVGSILNGSTDDSGYTYDAYRSEPPKVSRWARRKAATVDPDPDGAEDEAERASLLGS